MVLRQKAVWKGRGCMEPGREDSQVLMKELVTKKAGKSWATWVWGRCLDIRERQKDPWSG